MSKLWDAIIELLCRKLCSKKIANELSQTQIAILTLVSQGSSNKQIGEKLELSERTIKNYLSIVYRILGVNNRTKAAIVAMKRGLIE